MAVKGIKLDRFSAEIQKILDEYGEEVQSTLSEAAKETAEMGQKQLRAKSPVNQSSGKKRKKGRYAKGWRIKDVGIPTAPAYIVYNATDYQLTHLLEYGHPLKNGGRQYGYAKAYPHIKDAEDAMIQHFQKAVKEGLSR